MIRINLIAGDRRVVKSAAPALVIAQKVALAGSVILVIAAVLVGWRFWAITEREMRLAADLEGARQEEARLAEVLKQLAEFEGRRTQLQQRVALIDELRRGQSAPVHLIDQISRAVPEMTWLTSVKQQGYDVTIVGRSTTLSALSDFVGNLEATRFFRRPVEIVESEVAQGPKDGPDLIHFTIKGSFRMAGLDTPDAKTPAQAAAAKGGKVD